MPCKEIQLRAVWILIVWSREFIICHSARQLSSQLNMALPWDLLAVVSHNVDTHMQQLVLAQRLTCTSHGE
jgi:hypothetical protein